MHERAEKTTLEEWGGVGKNCAKVARQRLKLIQKNISRTFLAYDYESGETSWSIING